MEKIFSEYWGAFSFIAMLPILLIVWRFNYLEKKFDKENESIKKEYGKELKSLKDDYDKELKSLKEETVKIENSLDELRLNHENKVDQIIKAMQELMMAIVRIETTLNINHKKGE